MEKTKVEAAAKRICFLVPIAGIGQGEWTEKGLAVADVIRAAIAKATTGTPALTVTRPAGCTDLS